MALTDSNGGGLSAADVAAVVGNGGGFGGFGNDGAWWLIILFLFAMNGGWGNYGYGGMGGMMPWAMMGQGATTQADVQRGFDQSALMSGINGITTAINTGFGNAEVSRCNQQANILQTLNTNQAAQIAAMNSIGMSLQNCCCENRAGLADLKYTVATENCADRAAVGDGIRDVIANATANTQAILDKLCALELDGLKERNAQLLADNNALRLAQSQTAQTAQILADNAAQTATLRQALNPTPIPAYVVQNPSCCTPAYGCGCGAIA